MIHLDTSALVAALAGPGAASKRLERFIEDGERLAVSALVLYEWLRGPRRSIELEAQEALLPADAAIPFGSQEAEAAARLYRSASRPRGREIDLAIAGCAILHGAALWTLNPQDFKDLPGLDLV
jgi:predicted nucleic acid-binding protein